MHVRGARCMGSAAGVHGRRAGARGKQRWRADVRGLAGQAALARGCVRARGLPRGWHTAGTVHPRVTILHRNALNDLKQ
ncbi:hypothetical protein CRG98_005491 [Punica granatum]|uniref:Uncharacterized protein n=1 Tax=Punica granatum TaxID=22663 RepID=A0A2I0L088_PUNGR|nr:hypothetical protein CRG98_005491 [Punica granatum]